MNPLTSLPINRLDAWQAAALLARREIKSTDLVRACLDRIDGRATQVQAFANLNADAALAQARAIDAGPVRGLLHGLPFGVKDLFDSFDLPTAYGSPIYAKHQPLADAAAVADFMLPLALGTAKGSSLSTSHPRAFTTGVRPPHTMLTIANT